MANPSTRAVALIRARVTDWKPDDAEITAALNEPSRANPTPQARRPATLTVLGLMALLDTLALQKLEAAGLTVTLRDDIIRQDRPSVINWAAYGALMQHITPAQRDAVIAAVSADAPDPQYQAQISWAAANIGRPVDSGDVAAARPGE